MTMPQSRQFRDATKTSSRWPLALRVLSAILGGYAAANFGGVLLSYLIPASRSDAVLSSLLLSFALYTAIIVWAFAINSTLKACLTIWLTAASLALLCWALQRTMVTA